MDEIEPPTLRREQPHMVFDVNISETWWSLPSVYRNQVKEWFSQEGIDPDATRVEVYSDYAMVRSLLRDQDDRPVVVDDAYGDKSYKEHTVRVQISGQPPLRLRGM